MISELPAFKPGEKNLPGINYKSSESLRVGVQTSTVNIVFVCTKVLPPAASFKTITVVPLVI